MKPVSDYARPPRERHPANTKVAFGAGLMGLAVSMFLGSFVWGPDAEAYSLWDWMSAFSMLSFLPTLIAGAALFAFGITSR